MFIFFCAVLPILHTNNTDWFLDQRICNFKMRFVIRCIKSRYFTFFNSIDVLCSVLVVFRNSGNFISITIPTQLRRRIIVIFNGILISLTRNLLHESQIERSVFRMRCCSGNPCLRTGNIFGQGIGNRIVLRNTIGNK